MPELQRGRLKHVYMDVIKIWMKRRAYRRQNRPDQRQQLVSHSGSSLHDMHLSQLMQQHANLM